MRNFPLSLVVVGVAFLALGCQRNSAARPPVAAKSIWLTNYEQAQKEAKASNKLMLLNFTGSDWCGWCIVLDREVFSQARFKEYASKNLVLLEVDFPHGKHLAGAIEEQNVKLAQRFQIQGFPTVIMLNGDGKIVGELGYMEGGPDVFIAELEKVRKG